MEIFQLLSQSPPFFIVTAGLFGALLGSFLNVLIYRLPIMLEQAWTAQCQEYLQDETSSQQQENIADNKKFNLITPGSSCRNCQTAIRPWHNIPLVSYIILRGQCAYCQASISMRYPLVEFFTSAAMVFIAIKFGFSAQGLLAMVLVAALIPLALIDYDNKLLPDDITLPLIWAGLLVNSFAIFTSLENALFGAVLGYLSLWSVYWAFKLITGKEGMGYGDFKLLAALGAWLGSAYLLQIILLSSVVGAILGGISLAIKNNTADKTIPYGPYLAIAGLIALFWGADINQYYFDISGF